MTREVGRELGADCTVGTVCTGDLTPDCAILGSLCVCVLCLVDVCDALTKVEVRFSLGVHLVNLEDCGVGLGVRLATGVCLDDCLDVQLDLLDHLFLWGERVEEWESRGDQLIRCEVIEFCVVGMALDLVSLGFNLINGVESESGGICDKTQIKTLSVR